MISSGNVIIEGNYMLPDGTVDYGQIKVIDGRIEEIGPDVCIDGVDNLLMYGHNDLIFPGFIDLHVHARDYPLSWRPSPEEMEARRLAILKEDFITMCASAINGGVTAIAPMPNVGNPPTCYHSHKAMVKYARNRCNIDHLIYALATPGLKMRPDFTSHRAEADELLGNVPLKWFDHDWTVKQREEFFRKMGGLPYSPFVVIHAEDPEVLKVDPSRPVNAETRSVQACLELADKHQVRVHITHVSAGRTLDMIVKAKKSGVNVTCDTTGTYVIFPMLDVESMDNGSLIFMKPPYRNPEDAERLLEGMEDGDVDAFTTDHAPHLPLDKNDGMFGIPLEDHFTNMVGYLIDNGVSQKRVMEMCSKFPGIILGEYVKEKFGMIRPGYVGSFTVVSERPRGVFEPLATKCGWSPFKGSDLNLDRMLYAKETIVRGVPMKRGMYDEAA